MTESTAEGLDAQTPPWEGQFENVVTIQVLFPPSACVITAQRHRLAPNDVVGDDVGTWTGGIWPRPTILVT